MRNRIIVLGLEKKSREQVSLVLNKAFQNKAYIKKEKTDQY